MRKQRRRSASTVTATLISAFVFAAWIVQSLCFPNPKFQASSSILWLYSPLCVRPCRKPPKTGFLTSQLTWTSYMEAVPQYLVYILSPVTHNSFSLNHQSLEWFFTKECAGHASQTKGCLHTKRTRYRQRPTHNVKISWIACQSPNFDPWSIHLGLTKKMFF